MKRLAGFLLLAIVMAAQPAQASWVSDQIDEIIANVRAVKNEVTGDGNIKVVADDLRSQLEVLQSQGFFLRESVDDVLEWLQERRGPFQQFVRAAPGSQRCGHDSTCGQFRAELIEFVEGFAALRGNFPAIERLGLGDGSRAVRAIDISPPLMLFGLHEVLGQMDQWKDIPADLQQLFDEIDAPEVFSDGLSPFSPVAVASTQAAGPLSVFDKTPTQRFCERHEHRLERQIDPVRLNRLQFFVFYLRTALVLGESLTSETIGATILGEGTDSLIPNPLKAHLKLVISAIDVIQRGVGTFRANLDICRTQRRELEFQVAQCIELVDFVKPTKRDAVYLLVVDIVDKAEEEGVSVDQARKSLGQAEAHRDNERWKNAYRSLCDAYQKIGASTPGGAKPPKSAAST